VNKDVKRQWVAALRSGEYEQGQGALEWHNRFCCLGVLCDLAVKAGVAVRKNLELEAGISFADPDHPADNSTGNPPQVVMKWAGLDELGGGDLIHMNDVQKLSFKEIANRIEEEL